MPKQIDYECTKKEWDTFYDRANGVVYTKVFLAFVMSKFNLPSPSTWHGIILVRALNPGSDASGVISFTIEGFGAVKLSYTPPFTPSKGVPILPKNYRPSFPGSGHFQTKRTKQSRFEGRL